MKRTPALIIAASFFTLCGAPSPASAQEGEVDGLERPSEGEARLLESCGDGDESSCAALEDEVLSQGDLETLGSPEDQIAPDPPAPPPAASRDQRDPPALTPRVIVRLLHRIDGRVWTCFFNHALPRSNLDGEVMVTFVISPTGAVTASAPARSTVGDPDIDRCVADAVQRVSFPRPADGLPVVVSHSFRFSGYRRGR